MGMTKVLLGHGSTLWAPKPPEFGKSCLTPDLKTHSSGRTPMGLAVRAPLLNPTIRLFLKHQQGLQIGDAKPDVAPPLT